MSQFLRPAASVGGGATDGNWSNTGGGFNAALDETTPDDGDYIWSDDATSATIIIPLTEPGSIPAAGTVTVRYRIAKTANGTVDGSGGTVTVTISANEGDFGFGTDLDSDSGKSATGTWTTHEWNPDLSSLTDWDYLRIKIQVSNTSGRGAGISWIEVETPDGTGATYNETITETLTASDSFAAAATINATVSESVSVADSYAPAATINAALTETVTAADLYGLIYNETLTETLTASDSFLGGTDYYQTISESITASDTYAATVTEPNGWIIPAPPTDGWVQQGSGGGAWTEVSDTDTDWTEL